MSEFVFSEVLARAKESFQCKTDKALAEALGITPQALGNRKKIESIPYPEIISAAFDRCADVQYILTGVPSANALALDEQALLAGYRALDARGKAGVFGVIGGLAQSPGSIGQQFNAPIHQVAGNDIINRGGKKPRS